MLEVLMLVLIKIMAFWNAVLCELVNS